MFPHLLLLSTLTTLSSATQPSPPPSLPTPSQPPISPAQNATAPSGPPPPKLKNLTTPDDGYTFGNLVIHNWCSETFHLRSVGAHYLGGPRPGTHPSWAAPEDDAYHALPAYSTYTEPLRASGGCPYTGLPPYCPLEDKLAGQAVSVKISRSPSPADTNITQIEYALYRDPHTRDAFKRLYYDVSLLDCAAPEMLHPGGADVTDFAATPGMHAEKVRWCPGYEDGVAVSFAGDEGGETCPPVYCDGREKCLLIYTWDRTRKVEASFTCAREYRGDVRVDLCVGKGGAGAKGVAEGFSSWAKTATHKVLMLQLGKTASATGAPGALSTGAATPAGTVSGTLEGGSGSVAPPTGVAVPQSTVSGSLVVGSSSATLTTLATVGATSASGTA